MRSVPRNSTLPHPPGQHLKFAVKPSLRQDTASMGCRGSVVACATYKREMTGLIPGCSNVMLLGKALRLHVHSLNPGVSGYLAGQLRLVCVH